MGQREEREEIAMVRYLSGEVEYILLNMKLVLIWMPYYRKK
jgi:hypothetical protein